MAAALAIKDEVALQRTIQALHSYRHDNSAKNDIRTKIPLKSPKDLQAGGKLGEIARGMISALEQIRHTLYYINIAYKHELSLEKNARLFKGGVAGRIYNIKINLGNIIKEIESYERFWRWVNDHDRLPIFSYRYYSRTPPSKVIYGILDKEEHMAEELFILIHEHHKSVMEGKSKAAMF